MKNCCSVEMRRWIQNCWTHQIWTGDAERLGWRNYLFYLKNLLHLLKI